VPDQISKELSLITDLLTRLGLGNLSQWKIAFQDAQFYVATALALIGGVYGWYKTRAAFQSAARLSDILIEITGVGSREIADSPGKFEQYLWIAPLKQVRLGDLYSPLYIKAIAAAGKTQLRQNGTVVQLKSPAHTKGMMLRLKAAVKEVWAGYEIVSSQIQTRRNAASPYKPNTFYVFLRRDSWVDDRFQSFRVVMVPKWIVDRAKDSPDWLSQIIVDVKHQTDRLNHIRYIADHTEEIAKGPECGVIAVDFHFDPAEK
jgi:hypothetical protein